MRAMVLGACMLLLPAAAQAGGGLKRAEHLFKQMQYRQAVHAARRVIRDASSGPRDLVGAYRIEGLSLAAQGKTQQAFRSFCNLLAIDPAFRLSDDISPKLTPPFFQAVGASEKSKPVGLTHPPPRAPVHLGGLVLKVRLLANPRGLVHAVELRYRADGGKPEKIVVPVDKPGTLKMQLPQNLQASRVRYHLAAVNRHGAALAMVGSPKRPLSLRAPVAKPAPEAPRSGSGQTKDAAPVPRPVEMAAADKTGNKPGVRPRRIRTRIREPKRSNMPVPARQPDETGDDDDSAAWYQSWWFWTAVGTVVVAGTATGIVLGTKGGSSGPPYNYNILLE